MCQQRKSELLRFPSVINSGLHLPHGSSDVELCDCTGSLHCPSGASPDKLGQIIPLAHSAAAWNSEKALFYPSRLHISWGFQQQDLLVSVSLWDWSWSPLFGEVCISQEAWLKIIWHGKIVCNSVFRLSGNNSECGRRGSQKKVVRRKVYVILQ